MEITLHVISSAPSGPDNNARLTPLVNKREAVATVAASGGAASP